MTSSRQLHLGAFMRPASIHTGAWRYPGAYTDANFNIAHLRRFAQTLERVCIDTVERGKMTKDLALLIGPETPFLTTEGFLDELDWGLRAAMHKIIAA